MGTCEADLSSLKPQSPSPPPLDSSAGTKNSHDHVDPFTDDPLDQTLVQDFQSLSLVKDNDGAGNSPKGADFSDQYPPRPYAEDCSFYVKTGRCKFGPDCKFNHPLTRASYQENERGGFVEPVKRIECKYYLTSEGCKYGKACRFIHSNQISERAPKEFNSFAFTSQLASKETDGEGFVAQTEQVECKYYQSPRGCMYGEACKYSHSKDVELNFLGLPIQPLEKECPFYMQTGTCKYGVNCRFHHPDPTAVRGSSPFVLSNSTASATSASWGNINGSYNASQSTGSVEDRPSWSSQTTSKRVDLNFDDHSSFSSQSPLVHGHTQRKPAWSLYQVPAYLQEKSGNPFSSFLRDNQMKTNVTNYSEQIQGEEFPERPGQPECNYFMKTGNCKYKSACRYHHPKNITSKVPLCALSSSGLPLRPGEKICRHYEQYGICKYGRCCLYHHPENHFLPSLPVDSLREPLPVISAADSGWE